MATSRFRKQLTGLFLFSLGVALLIFPLYGEEKTSTKPGRPEVISLLGESLNGAPAEGETLEKLKKELEEAETQFHKGPVDAESYILLGRRLAYLWRYYDAIGIYSQGIEKYPGYAMLYRHRGHRYISIRKFDKAIEDLQKASELKKDDFDTWYHLGLAYYLKGKFDPALDAYKQCMKYAKDDDSKIAISNWTFLTYLRLNQPSEGTKLLKKIKPGMKVVENGAYYDLLFLYKGQKSIDEVIAKAAKTPLDMNTLGFGAAIYEIYSGNKDKGTEILRKIIKNHQYWPAFGFIAAETEIKRIDAGKMPVFYHSSQKNPMVSTTDVWEVLKKWVAFWNTYDLDEVDRLFLHSDRLTYFSSEKVGVITGFDAVKKHHEGFGFVPGGKDVLNQLWIDDVQVSIFGSTAVVTGIWYFQKDKGSSPKVQQGPFTFIYTADQGTLRLAHAHFSNYPALR